MTACQQVKYNATLKTKLLLVYLAKDGGAKFGWNTLKVQGFNGRIQIENFCVATAKAALPHVALGAREEWCQLHFVIGLSKLKDDLLERVEFPIASVDIVLIDLKANNNAC